MSMRRLWALVTCTTALTCGSVVTLFAQAPAPDHQVLLLWAAGVGPLVSTITIVTVVLRLGRWSQRTESSTAELNRQLAACRRECDGRFKELTDHGSDYAHKNIHDVRGDLQTAILRVGVDYARKDVVAQGFDALRELMRTTNDSICKRLDKIEERLEAHE
jgi:hypothetical protein